VLFLTSLRRSAIKARRSFLRLFQEIHLREGPTSEWLDRREVARKLQEASRRAYNAEKRLHVSGMPKERAEQVVRSPREIITEEINAQGERVQHINLNPVSKGYERKQK
jgi:hypothetical protein